MTYNSRKTRQSITCPECPMDERPVDVESFELNGLIGYGTTTRGRGLKSLQPHLKSLYIGTTRFHFLGFDENQNRRLLLTRIKIVDSS